MKMICFRICIAVIMICSVLVNAYAESLEPIMLAEYAESIDEENFQASTDYADETADTPHLPAKQQCSCNTACNSSFANCRRTKMFQPYVSAEALFLNLDCGRKGSLVEDALTQNTVLDSKDLGYSTVAGPRLTFGLLRSNSRYSLEATYFGLHRWTEDRTVTGNNNLCLPGDFPLATLDYFMADRFRFQYSADLHSVEANFIKHIRCESLSLVAGFRHVAFHEEFNINASDSDTGESSDYNILARNNLFGGQIGFRQKQFFDCLGYSINGNAGIFGNTAKQHTYVGDFDNRREFRNLDAKDSPVAFVGDLNANIHYRFGKNLNLTAGYNLLWLNRIARAANQLDFTDTPESAHRVVTNRGALMHGASVGLCYNF